MLQLVVFGVTVYTAVLTVLVALKSVPKILVWRTVADCPPVSDPVLTAGIVHVYFVPLGTMPLIPLVGVTWNGDPLQTVVLISVIKDCGFT